MFFNLLLIRCPDQELRIYYLGDLINAKLEIKMEFYVLRKSPVLLKFSGRRLALNYIIGLIEQNQRVLFFLSQIEIMFNELTINDDGQIANLQTEKNSGREVHFLVEKMYNPLTQEFASWKLIKFLNSSSRSYEVRVDSQSEHIRLVFSPNLFHNEWAIVYSFGMTKRPGILKYLPEERSANWLTTQFSVKTDEISFELEQLNDHRRNDFLEEM